MASMACNDAIAAIATFKIATKTQRQDAQNTPHHPQPQAN